MTSSANSCAGLGTSQATTLTITWHYKNSAGVTLAKLTPTTVTFSGFDVLTNGFLEPGFEPTPGFRRNDDCDGFVRRDLLAGRHLHHQDEQHHHEEVRYVHRAHVAAARGPGHGLRSVAVDHRLTQALVPQPTE